MDIDVGEGKPYAKRSEALKAVVAFSDAVDLPRPYVVRSGDGLHIYWPLDLDIAPGEWKPAAQMLKEAAKRHGLAQDPSRTADEASILRPVGSTHRKADPKPVKMVMDGQVTTFEVVQAVLAAYLGVQAPVALGTLPAGLPQALNSDLSGGMEYPPAF
ncbi:MAG TPA: hypothetical protein VD906_06835, partial [Caulobacteraceae bacterium]|nr:hypothetical protein [Caulobacteraceae bacterium]